MKSFMNVYLNGDIVDASDAKISIFDHGFLYGDGVFETMRAYGHDKKIFKLAEHVERLFASAKRISLRIPLNEKKIKEAIEKTVAANSSRESALASPDFYVRISVSRGVGDTGLDPGRCGTPTIAIMVKNIALDEKIEKIYSKGVSAAIVKTVKNIPAALPPQIKSMNFLNGILAKIEAKNRGAYEGFMLDAEGYVAEGTISNIFIVKSGKVMTPPRHNILSGITRETVLSLAKKRGIRTEEALVTPEKLYEAEECFITSSIMELVPVVTVDGKKIGTGAPGKMTDCLLKAYRALARAR